MRCDTFCVKCSVPLVREFLADIYYCPNRCGTVKDIDAFIDEPRKCNCNLFDVMNYGCKCGGV